MTFRTKGPISPNGIPTMSDMMSMVGGGGPTDPTGTYDSLKLLSAAMEQAARLATEEEDRLKLIDPRAEPTYNPKATLSVARVIGQAAGTERPQDSFQSPDAVAERRAKDILKPAGA